MSVATAFRGKTTAPGWRPSPHETQGMLSPPPNLILPGTCCVIQTRLPSAKQMTENVPHSPATTSTLCYQSKQRKTKNINTSNSNKLFTNTAGKYYSRHPLYTERGRDFTALPACLYSEISIRYLHVTPSLLGVVSCLRFSALFPA